MPFETKEMKCNLTFSWWLKVNFGISMLTLGALPSMILKCSMIPAPMLIIPQGYYFKVCVTWFSFSVSYWQSVNDNFEHFIVYTHLTISLLLLIFFLQLITMACYVPGITLTKFSKVKFHMRKPKWISVKRVSSWISAPVQRPFLSIPSSPFSRVWLFAKYPPGSWDVNVILAS